MRVQMSVFPEAPRCTSLRCARTGVRACVRHCLSRVRASVCVLTVCVLFQEAVNEAHVQCNASFSPKEACTVQVLMVADVRAIKSRHESSHSTQNELWCGRVSVENE